MTRVGPEASSSPQRARPTWPIWLAGIVPSLVALPGIYLGVRQMQNALQQPGGIVGLGIVLGFWLLVGAVFVVCIAVQVTGMALDVRELRNRAAAPTTRE